jgi:hypothetical protein
LRPARSSATSRVVSEVGARSSGYRTPALREKVEQVSPETTNRTFDELTRGLATGSISRGRALKMMGAALVGGTLTSVGLGGVAAADEDCKKAGKKCRKDGQCCSGKCESGTCTACPTGKVKLSNGTCATPCTTAPECPNCVCIGASVNPDFSTGFCGMPSPGSGCATDDNCPTGQFCAEIFGGTSCVPAC